MKKRVGFIGLGRMGNPMCQHILKAGFDLAVFDLQQPLVQALVVQGAQGAASAREVAEKSDVIHVMVADDEQVRTVVDELLQSAAPGSVLVISSSVHPQTCRDLAEQAQSRGVGLVDAPVARGIRGAETGTLTVFVGGEESDVEKCRPVFAAYAEAVFHMGNVGYGQITKTCNNLMHWAEIVACYETLSLGKRLGLSPNDLRPAMLAGSADSRTLRELELIKLTWPDKDMATALALAGESDTPLPLMERVRELIKQISADDLRTLFV